MESNEKVDEATLVIIGQAVERRISEGRAPFDPTLMDLNRCLKDSLNRLFRKGKIHVGDTINDKYIRLKE